MIIQFCLFIALSVYFILDHYHTVALITYGLEEINPFVLWIVGEPAQWENLLAVKVGLLVFLGGLLILNYYDKKRREHEKNIDKFLGLI